MTEDRHVVLLCMWDQILFHGIPENKLLYPGPVHRLGINHWLMLQLKLYGYRLCLMSWECHRLKQHYCGVTILEQHIFLLIMCFMLGLSILMRWIIILFERDLLRSCWTLGLYLQEIKWLIDSQNHCLLDN
jgi:hypothetical protein